MSRFVRLALFLCLGADCATSPPTPPEPKRVFLTRCQTCQWMCQDAFRVCDRYGTTQFQCFADRGQCLQDCEIALSEPPNQAFHQ